MSEINIQSLLRSLESHDAAVGDPDGWLALVSQVVAWLRPAAVWISTPTGELLRQYVASNDGPLPDLSSHARTLAGSLGRECKRETLSTGDGRQLWGVACDLPDGEAVLGVMGEEPGQATPAQTQASLIGLAQLVSACIALKDNDRYHHIRLQQIESERRAAESSRMEVLEAMLEEREAWLKQQQSVASRIEDEVQSRTADILAATAHGEPAHREPSHSGPAVQNPPPHESANPPTPSHTTPQASGEELSRVLLVEDVADSRMLMQMLLKAEGFTVQTAENGREAVEKTLEALASGKPFGTVLMDMQMPIMDGYTATRSLREQGYTGVIAALTAHAMASDRQRCLDAGCDDYFTKPVNTEKLVAFLRRRGKQSQTLH
ncbi:MAG: response regulator [Phycisphaera sp.]|nr:response regulator [Phycisphaera sp.]